MGLVSVGHFLDLFVQSASRARHLVGALRTKRALDAPLYAPAYSD